MICGTSGCTKKCSVYPRYLSKNLRIILAGSHWNEIGSKYQQTNIWRSYLPAVRVSAPHRQYCCSYAQKKRADTKPPFAMPSKSRPCAVYLRSRGTSIPSLQPRCHVSSPSSILRHLPHSNTQTLKTTYWYAPSAALGADAADVAVVGISGLVVRVGGIAVAIVAVESVDVGHGAGGWRSGFDSVAAGCRLPLKNEPVRWSVLQKRVRNQWFWMKIFKLNYGNDEI